MASMQEPTFSLRLFVDEERKRVVLAEAGGDFVDTLFSFLTLPLGTIIRRVSENTHQPGEIGCINNLYRSVEEMNSEVFWNQICKEMLLSPRNPCETLCQKLKLNVDDTTPTKYWMCGSCASHGRTGLLLSTFAGTKCSCGKLMNKEMKLHEESNEEDKRNGVFVKGATNYLIFDDLNVLQNSPGDSIQQLVKLGYKNFNKLEEMFPKVGLKEILELLKQALTSKSPLSDVMLRKSNEEFKPMCSSSPVRENSMSKSNQISLKITASKSKDKILCAEAEGDSFDFLLSFLTMPLGSVLKVLDGNVSLGSMDNLYRSVKDLNPSWFRESLNTLLLNLKVAPQFGCRRQPLELKEEVTPSYWYGTSVTRNNICDMNRNKVISKNKSQVIDPIAMKLFEPRSSDGAREPAVGFVRRPSLFAIMDDLRVTTLTSKSSISFLQELNVAFDDFDVHVVSIGKAEALNLLRASLTSKAAFTNGLFYLIKNAREAAKRGGDDPEISELSCS